MRNKESCSMRMGTVCVCPYSGLFAHVKTKAVGKYIYMSFWESLTSKMMSMNACAMPTLTTELNWVGQTPANVVETVKRPW